MKAVAVAIATGLIALSCSLGGTAAPIVGYWSFKGGVIKVSAVGSAYDGIVVRQPQSGACAEPVGYSLLKLKGSGSHYTGQEEWWEDPGCERRYSNTATVDIKGNTARLCSGDPFPGPPPSECVDMTRVAKP